MTLVEVAGYHPKMTYKDSVFMTGSCFAEHIDKKLRRYKYNVLGNPFGILYNPASLTESFRRIAGKNYYQSSELVLHDGLYHSMDHHGSFSHPDRDIVLQKINDQIDASHAHLKTIKYVFISLGTVHAYIYKATGKIAGNNHKIPSSAFEAVTLNTEKCIDEMNEMYSLIKGLSSDAHIIWTVSPIRHLKDGLVQNQRSKATLILSIALFVAAHNDSVYFPAYEIMVDQLRDYRYYDRDLIHPSALATDIIWDTFSQTFIDPQEALHHVAMEKIHRAREHRMLHDNKVAIKSFAESQLRNIDHLSLLYPEMNWKEERQYFFHLIEPD